MKKNKIYFLLLAIISLALALRLYKIDAKSLWYDESMTWQHLENYSAKQILLGEFHTYPPFYSLLLKGWLALTGKTVFAMRLLSVILGVFSIFSIFMLASLIYGPGAGLLSAFLASIAPFNIFYSQEMGIFSWFLLISTVFYYFFIKIILTQNEAPRAKARGFSERNTETAFILCPKDGVFKRRMYKKLFLPLVTATFILLVSHYYSFIVIITADILGFVYLKKRKDIFWKIIVLQLTLFVLLIPLTAICHKIFFIQNKISYMAWIPFCSFGQALAKMIPAFSYGGPEYGGGDFYINKSKLYPATWLTFLYIILIVSALFYSVKNKKDQISAVFLSGFLFVPLLLMVLFGYLFFPILLIRQLIFIIPFFYILVAKGLLDLKNKKMLSGLIMIFIVTLNAIALDYYYKHEIKFPWHKVAVYLKAKGITQHDIIVFNPLYMHYLLFHNKVTLPKDKQIAIIPFMNYFPLAQIGVNSFCFNRHGRADYQKDKIEIFADTRIILVQSRWVPLYTPKPNKGLFLKYLDRYRRGAVKPRRETYGENCDPIDGYNLFNSTVIKDSEIIIDHDGNQIESWNNFKDVFLGSRGVYIGIGRLKN